MICQVSFRGGCINLKEIHIVFENDLESHNYYHLVNLITNLTVLNLNSTDRCLILFIISLASNFLLESNSDVRNELQSV